MVSLMNGVLLVVIPLTLRLSCRAPAECLRPRCAGLAPQALAGTTGLPAGGASGVHGQLPFAEDLGTAQTPAGTDGHGRAERPDRRPGVSVGRFARPRRRGAAVPGDHPELARSGSAPEDARDAELFDLPGEWSSLTALPAAEEVPAAPIPECAHARCRRGGVIFRRWTAPAAAEEVGLHPPFCLTSRRGWPKHRVRDSLAPVVMTSALFAAVHLPQWPAPIAIFFLSVGLGLVYQRTGSPARVLSDARPV